MIKFSEEEMKKIDEKLKQAEELQLRNGNIMYTTEEILEMIYKTLEGGVKYIPN